MPIEIQILPDGIGFWIHVSPRARCEAIEGTHGTALRVSVKAPPVDGKANIRCQELIASALGVARKQVSIDPGSRHRRKRVQVQGDPGKLQILIQDLASGNHLR